ncbi:hypothetical protein Hanom_Chr07g00657411 [Helianthus anomalus]
MCYSSCDDFKLDIAIVSWITDGSLEYHCVISEIIRSYPSTLIIMLIHQFKRKSNKYGKNPFVGIEPRTY